MRSLAPELGSGYRLAGATFSPDGTKVLYVFRESAGGRSFIAVRDAGADSGTLLMESQDPTLGASRRNGALGMLGLSWAANDAALLLTNAGSGALLLSLGVR